MNVRTGASRVASQVLLTRLDRLHNIAALSSLYSACTQPVLCCCVKRYCAGMQWLMGLSTDGLGAGSIVWACVIMILLIWACCCIRQYCPCMQCPMAPPPTQMQTVGLSTGGLGGGGFPSAPPPANPAYAMRENLPDIVPTVGRPRVSVDQNLFQMLAEDSTINK